MYYLVLIFAVALSGPNDTLDCVLSTLLFAPVLALAL